MAPKMNPGSNKNGTIDGPRTAKGRLCHPLKPFGFKHQTGRALRRPLRIMGDCLLCSLGFGCASTVDQNDVGGPTLTAVGVVGNALIFLASFSSYGLGGQHAVSGTRQHHRSYHFDILVITCRAPRGRWEQLPGSCYSGRSRLLRRVSCILAHFAP